ncbi:hypothetical protein HAX54_026943 [Datura stramonium]|uniref:Pre-rRNA-processing protein TSR2 homolog n=1 Tax=Datura stramonium TaxID=4076 RepID=A0ABS8S8A8_DATST|nr:hypothetical protein [Datura stramonium]
MHTPSLQSYGTDMPTSSAFDKIVSSGISKALSKWPGLQMAIQNEWGGPDSPQKSKQLSFDMFSCLSQSNAAIGVDDIENMIYERLLLSFNTDIDDGSIEEVIHMYILIDLRCVW